MKELCDYEGCRKKPQPCALVTLSAAAFQQDFVYFLRALGQGQRAGSRGIRRLVQARNRAAFHAEKVRMASSFGRAGLQLEAPNMVARVKPR